MNLQSQKRLPWRLLIGHAVITLLCALIWLLTKGRLAFYSALFAGAAWTLPSFYTSRKLMHIIFPPRRDQNSIGLWKTFLGLEILKIITASSLLVLGSVFLTLNILAAISTYMAAVLFGYVIVFFQ